MVKALRRRDPEAMSLIMRAHGRALLGYLESVLRDRPLAEDVLQQVLLEIWQRGPTYDPARAGLLTWTLMIARSRALDERRRRVPVPVDPADAAGAVEPDPSDGLLDRWRIAGLLTRLPRDEASLLRMRFYEGLSQAEIAEQTGIALGTVKARMVSGLAQLRTMLEAERSDGV